MLMAPNARADGSPSCHTGTYVWQLEVKHDYRIRPRKRQALPCIKAHENLVPKPEHVIHLWRMSNCCFHARDLLENITDSILPRQQAYG